MQFCRLAFGAAGSPGAQSVAEDTILPIAGSGGDPKRAVELASMLALITLFQAGCVVAGLLALRWARRRRAGSCRGR